MLLPFALAQLPQMEQPPRLRTILPNGATILVERVPGASRVWTRLFLSARGGEDTPATYGFRHLLEHLVATGRDGKIDGRLEREGAYLSAETLRDASIFACDAPSGKLDLALNALGEMLRLRPLSTADLSREVGIMRQEESLIDPSARLSSAAWQTAYGPQGLSPFGDLAAMRRATPAAISALHARLCAGPNLIVVVAGDVDLDKTTAAAASMVRAAPRVDGTFAVRTEGKGGSAEADTLGEARALPVPAYDEPQTAAALAAALCVASDLDDVFVTYTPSVRPGLVVLGRSGESSGLAAKVAAANAAALWPRAKRLAEAWLRRQTTSPAANATLRGLLLAQSVDATPDRMRDAIAAMTYAQFASAVAALKGPKAVQVMGQ